MEASVEFNVCLVVQKKVVYKNPAGGRPATGSPLKCSTTVMGNSKASVDKIMGKDRMDELKKEDDFVLWTYTESEGAEHLRSLTSLSAINRPGSSGLEISHRLCPPTSQHLPQQPIHSTSTTVLSLLGTKLNSDLPRPEGFCGAAPTNTTQQIQ